jgi:hypothetical protein
MQFTTARTSTLSSLVGPFCGVKNNVRGIITAEAADARPDAAGLPGAAFLDPHPGSLVGPFCGVKNNVRGIITAEAADARPDAAGLPGAAFLDPHPAR